MEGRSLRQSEEEKGKVRAVASDSSPPCREAWAVPCVPFPNAHLAIVSQITTMKDRVSLGEYSHQAAALQCGDIYGKEKFLSLNKTPDQVL